MHVPWDTWMSQEVSINDLLINGIYWGYKTLIFTLDPNFRPGTSKPLFGALHFFRCHGPEKVCWNSGISTSPLTDGTKKFGVCEWSIRKFLWLQFPRIKSVLFLSGNVANPSSLEGNKTAAKLAPNYRSSFTSRIVVTTFVGKKQPLTQRKQGTSEKTPALK